MVPLPSFWQLSHWPVYLTVDESRGGVEAEVRQSEAEGRQKHSYVLVSVCKRHDALVVAAKAILEEALEDVAVAVLKHS
jgi:hypothetical protein